MEKNKVTENIVRFEDKVVILLTALQVTNREFCYYRLFIPNLISDDICTSVKKYLDSNIQLNVHLNTV